ALCSPLIDPRWASRGLRSEWMKGQGSVFAIGEASYGSGRRESRMFDKRLAEEVGVDLGGLGAVEELCEHRREPRRLLEGEEVARPRQEGHPAPGDRLVRGVRMRHG